MSNPNGRPRRSLIDRFEDFYVPDPNSGCWLWIGVSNAQGYGHFKIPDQYGEWRTVKAHRAAYQLYRGVEVPSNMQLMHKCDTPCCVNPDHLEIGTRNDNQQDMARKGRGTKSSIGLPWGVMQPKRSSKYYVQFRVHGTYYRGGKGFDTPAQAHDFAVAYRQEVLRQIEHKEA